jgi:hypothetical protein
MRKKISVIGSKGVEIAHELAAYAEVGDDLSGADVVVLAGDGDLAAIRRSAPAAVLVVAGDSVEDRCRALAEATLFPRARIVGVADPARVGPVVESIMFERGDEHEVVAMSDGQFGARTARLGRGGIRALL